jgi:ketosteroid isomerase-like protein
MEATLRDLVEAGYSALSSGDAEQMVAVCDPDVSFQSRITAVEEVTYRGYDGIRRFFDRLNEVFESFAVEPTEIETGDECAVAVARFRARLSRGLEVEQVFYHAMRTRQGRALWWAFYDSLDEARAAVQL